MRIRLLTNPTPDNRYRRSVSQLKQYERCPYSWYRARVEKRWRRPAAWTAQGTAFHAAAQWWEEGGRTGSLEATQEVFETEYVKAIGELCEGTPNFEWWFSSGRYHAWDDIPRRHDIGMQQVARYHDWYGAHPEQVIWITPDGTLGCELEFNIDLDGVLINGSVDAVINDLSAAVYSYDGVGEVMADQFGDEPRMIPSLIVRDNKTGSAKNLGGDLQLGIYSVALSEMYGLFGPYKGDYWMGQTGRPTTPYDLTDWTRRRVSERFHELEENIGAERFDPLPESSKCRFCDVAFGCRYAVV